MEPHPSAPPPAIQIKLLTLQFAPALGAIDPRPLDAFLADKEVLTLREHFFEVHGLPHLTCLITYRLPRGRDTADRPAPSTERPRTAPVELEDHERPLFETLRTWRAERARNDGVPPYIVFTNRELAAIVRARPSTPNALSAIHGIGPGKVERYGKDLLSRLRPDDAAPDPEPAVAPAEVTP